MPRVLVGILALLVVPAALAADPCVDEGPGAKRSDAGPCLNAGYWARVKPLDDCRFTFSAGLSPTAQRKPNSRPLKFHVSGGRCEPWPNRPLSATGTSVQCVRSGNGSATVTLATAEGELRSVLGAIPARRVPEEPVLEKRRSSPKIEVITLYRSRDYRQVEFGRSCPVCRLLAADIRPSEPNATILDVGVVSAGNTGRWFRCPAGWRCGVPEFSPPDEPRVTGCAGRQACRVWRLSEDESEAQDTVQIKYEVEQAMCRNCSEGVDYSSAHKRWEAAVEQAQRACEAFPDDPAQLFGTRPAR
jgi:hypothetical protein